MALQKRASPFSPPETKPETAAAQLEIGEMMQTGAAVESMRYANFYLVTPLRTAIGRITEPTVRQLK